MMKFEDKLFIAEKIRYYRKKKNLTQSELAEMVDISDQHLSRIESGCYVPSLKTFFLLADALEIDLREFGFKSEQTQNTLKNKLISEIVNANDTKLVFIKNMIDSVNQSFREIRKDFL